MKKRWRGSPSRVRKIPAPAAIPTCARWPTPPRRSTLTWAPPVGSYASVARMLDEVASVPGTDGVLLTFDDFLAGIDAFGERIQPLMRCRNHIASVTREVA